MLQESRVQHHDYRSQFSVHAVTIDAKTSTYYCPFLGHFCNIKNSPRLFHLTCSLATALHRSLSIAYAERLVPEIDPILGISRLCLLSSNPKENRGHRQSDCLARFLSGCFVYPALLTALNSPSYSPYLQFHDSIKQYDDHQGVQTVHLRSTNPCLST